jgi:hypothetical protein
MDTKKWWEEEHAKAVIEAEAKYLRVIEEESDASSWHDTNIKSATACN